MNIPPVTSFKGFQRITNRSSEQELANDSFSDPKTKSDQFIPNTSSNNTDDRYNPGFIRSGLQNNGLLLTLLSALDQAKSQNNTELMKKIMQKIAGFGLL